MVEIILYERQYGNRLKCVLLTKMFRRLRNIAESLKKKIGINYAVSKIYYRVAKNADACSKS